MHADSPPSRAIGGANTRRGLAWMIGLALGGGCGREVLDLSPRVQRDGGALTVTPEVTAEAGSREAGDQDAQGRPCGADADCTGSDQVCDLAGGRCVDCTTDAHCPLSTWAPRCDVTTHSCVQCFQSSDCSGPPSFGFLGGLCVDGFCSECSTAAECPAAAPFCSGGRCSECSENANCSGALPYCQFGRCVQCVGDPDCSGGTPRCQPLLGSCVQCTQPDDCGRGAVCNPFQGVCRRE